MRFNGASFQTSKNTKKYSIVEKLFAMFALKNSQKQQMFHYILLTFLYIWHLLTALQQTESIFEQNFRVVYRLRCNHHNLAVVRCSVLSTTFERCSTGNGSQTKTKWCPLQNQIAQQTYTFDSIDTPNYLFTYY